MFKPGTKVEYKIHMKYVKLMVENSTALLFPVLYSLFILFIQTVDIIMLYRHNTITSTDSRR